MASMLSVPTVTPNDLLAFRARIFNDVPVPETSAQDLEDEDDDLGYYPDGVKRTLTDDQVAMFRHSEVYSLLRERQREKEKADAEPGAEAKEDQSNKHLTSIAGDSEIPRSLEDTIGGDSDDEEEYARFLESEQRELRAQAAKKSKRKRYTAEGVDERGRPPTARRIAREMDEVTMDNTVLDYGEEESPSGGNDLHQVDADGANGRTRVSYEDTAEPYAAESTKTEPSPAVEGRKIWWPVIGGS